MTLLPEFAILPELFLKAGHDEVSKMQLAYLRDAVLRDAAVRDLRDGEWRRLLWDKRGAMSLIAQKLAKTLCSGRSLASASPVLPNSPSSEEEWCDEAIASAKTRPLTAIICSPSLDKAHQQQSAVHPLDTLSETNLGQIATASVQTLFRIGEYIEHIGAILSTARRLCFIDPYIDPEHRDYGEFPELLRHAGKRHPAPKLEIHRKCSYKRKTDAKEGQLKDSSAWKTIFADWHQLLEAEGIVAEVFIWDDFKTRYLVSELAGLIVGKGFKTNKDPKAKNTWSRLSREDGQNVDREFDENSTAHKLWCHFEIGGEK